VRLTEVSAQEARIILRLREAHARTAKRHERLAEKYQRLASEHGDPQPAPLERIAVKRPVATVIPLDPRASTAHIEASERGFHSPMTFAAVMQVSKRTVDGWLAAGRVPGAWKTTDSAAGHWRIPLDAPEQMRRSRETRKGK
jgi:hypothetical protein